MHSKILFVHAFEKTHVFCMWLCMSCETPSHIPWEIAAFVILGSSFAADIQQH